MDRDEALRLLKGGRDGIAEWNRRRDADEPIPHLEQADLREANLGDADLSLANLGRANLSRADLSLANINGANLNWANLREANLSGANLSGANVSGADLRRAFVLEAELYRTDFSEADLSEATLTNANLRGANLRNAHLIAADLSLANLRDANLSEANLSGANVSAARCFRTVFGDTTLDAVEGLDSVRHGGPSTIGIDTLFRSQGTIPEAFLRGCGVPDELIKYLPSLIGSMSPIQFYSCFISYSTKNQDFAGRLHSKMRDKGLRVWFAPEDIQGGKKLHEQIDEAIRIYDKLLLVLSPDSMNSEWVKTEIHNARKAEIREGKRKLFPIRLVDFDALRDWKCFDTDSGKDLGREIREYFIPDFSNWKDHDSFEAAFARLLNDLKAEGTPGAEPA
jgi:hypothetical protein